MENFPGASSRNTLLQPEDEFRSDEAGQFTFVVEDIKDPLLTGTLCKPLLLFTKIV